MVKKPLYLIVIHQTTLYIELNSKTAITRNKEVKLYGSCISYPYIVKTYNYSLKGSLYILVNSAVCKEEIFSTRNIGQNKLGWINFSIK